ncbi:DNA helicase, variant 2 [Balamuthia mandrillaris]
MENQVSGLLKKGIHASILCSAQSKKDKTAVEQDISSAKPRTKLLYVTPELIATPNFQRILLKLYDRNQLGMFAVDEAHAISEWGHDFRSAYRKLSVLKEKFPYIPICALTATATTTYPFSYCFPSLSLSLSLSPLPSPLTPSYTVREDVTTQLCLQSPLSVCLSFNRPNIYYEVRFKELTTYVYEDISTFIATQPPGSGIVYCHRRETCEDVARRLRSAQIKAEPYHAGLKDTERRTVQSKWASGEVDVMVATIAFGMGIDKPDVRYVIHFNLPKNLEGFYQESGRGGRDGQPAKSLLYYSQQDESLNNFLLEKEFERQRQRLNLPDGKLSIQQQAAESTWKKMVAYCKAGSCRRKLLLAYFGERFGGSSSGCGNCDYCIDGGKTVKANLKRLRKNNVLNDSWQQAKMLQQATGENEAEDEEGGSNGSSSSSSSSSFTRAATYSTMTKKQKAAFISAQSYKAERKAAEQEALLREEKEESRKRPLPDGPTLADFDHDPDDFFAALERAEEEAEEEEEASSRHRQKGKERLKQKCGAGPISSFQMASQVRAAAIRGHHQSATHAPKAPSTSTSSTTTAANNSRSSRHEKTIASYFPAPSKRRRSSTPDDDDIL